MREPRQERKMASFPTPLTLAGKIGHVLYRHVCNLKPVGVSRDQGGEASSRGGKRARSLTLTTGSLIQLRAVACCFYSIYKLLFSFS